MENNRLVELSINNNRCSLLIEVNGLGCHDTIQLDESELAEFKSLSRLPRSADRNQQDIVIDRFREVQKRKDATDSHVYSQCDNNSDDY